MTTKVTILYEDSRGPPASKLFGTHELVVALVADALDRDRWDLRRDTAAVPARSNSKLREKCTQVGKLIAPDCHPVVAIYDADKIRGLDRKAFAKLSMRDIEKRLAAECPSPGKLRVALLEQNLESVIHQLRRIEPDAARHGVQYDRALDHKDRMARDAILCRVAGGPRAVRDALLEELPSLGHIRDLVKRALKDADSCRSR